MHKIVPVAVLGLGLAMLSLASPPASADPAKPPTIGTVPKMSVVPPMIASVKRRPTLNASPHAVNMDTYVSGPITYDVEVTNGAPQKVDTTLVVKRYGERDDTTFTVPVHVEAKGSATVSFTDPRGLPSGCTGPQHILVLGSNAPIYAKTAPQCSWSYAATNGWSQMTPDRLADIRKDKAYFENAETYRPGGGSDLRCEGTIVFKATVVNKSAKEATNLALALDGPTASKGQSPAFSLAGGKSRETTVSAPFDGTQGAYNLKLNGGGAVAVADPAFSYKLERFCAARVTTSSAPLP